MRCKCDGDISVSVLYIYDPLLYIADKSSVLWSAVGHIYLRHCRSVSVHFIIACHCRKESADLSTLYVGPQQGIGVVVIMEPSPLIKRLFSKHAVV